MQDGRQAEKQLVEALLGIREHLIEDQVGGLHLHHVDRQRGNVAAQPIFQEARHVERLRRVDLEGVGENGHDGFPLLDVLVLVALHRFGVQVGLQDLGMQNDHKLVGLGFGTEAEKQQDDDHEVGAVADFRHLEEKIGKDPDDGSLHIFFVGFFGN